MQFDVKLIGARICSARNQSNMTQDDLAEATGLNPKHISAIENGNRIMQIDTMFKICIALRLDFTYLMTGEDAALHRTDLQKKIEKLDTEEYSAVKSVVDALSKRLRPDL